MKLNWKDENERSSCLHQFNINMEAHGYIYRREDNHIQLDIEVFADSVKMSDLTSHLNKHLIPVEYVGEHHDENNLRGECVLYRETLASIRDAKYAYELFVGDYRRVMRTA